MTEPRHILQDITAETQAHKEVENLRADLNKQAQENSKAAIEASLKANLANEPEAREHWRREARNLQVEANICKQKSSDITHNFDSYVQSFKDSAKNNSKAGPDANNDVAKSKNAGHEQEKGNEMQSSSPTSPPHVTVHHVMEKDKTPGQQIEHELTQGDGILDKAFAQAMGAVADRVANRTHEREREQEWER